MSFNKKVSLVLGAVVGVVLVHTFALKKLIESNNILVNEVTDLLDQRYQEHVDEKFIDIANREDFDI